MCSVVNEKSSLKTICHCSPHLQLWFSGSEIVVFATWPIDLRLLKYFGTSKKFLRTSGFLKATCPGQVAEKKIWSPLCYYCGYSCLETIWRSYIRKETGDSLYVHRKQILAPFPKGISPKSCRSHKVWNLPLDFLLPNSKKIPSFKNKISFTKYSNKALRKDKPYNKPFNILVLGAFANLLNWTLFQRSVIA